MDPVRRDVLRLGLAVAVVPLVQLLGCDKKDGGAGGSTDGGTPELDGALDEGPTADAAPNPVVDAGDPGFWATGGTASMSADYGNPFAAGLGAACTLYCASTLGPCYVDTIERRDISEGQPGLPMRLVFLVVDQGCTPIEGATVDVWHTSATGLYSGADAAAMCTLNDAEARAGKWFRGVQTTDAAGRVDFNSCFPGWYQGRTLHIHFTVRLNGGEEVTSQLFFADSLADDIIGSQPIYQDKGARDTTNADDSVVAAGAVDPYLMETRRAADGALVAWKALVIRGAAGGDLCEIPSG